jgi:hypothetical protein
VFNVSMAVGIGVFFGWIRQGLQVLVAVALGAVVTILGLDLLVLVPSPIEMSTSGCLPMPPSIASLSSLHCSGW